MSRNLDGLVHRREPLHVMTRLLTLSADHPAHIKAPKPGDVLGGKYRIEREIGSGGMGIVYEVTHLVMTKKRFAVKWLLPLPDGYHGEEGQAAARRFVREAEIAGRICHPHVVEVYDVTIGDSGCFMVMELLEGESLEARMKREPQLPVPEACRIIVACASGVSAAHAANVIHRDLKPANIFLSRAPGIERAREPACPKVLDFGISRFTAPEGSVQSTVTRAGTLVGTPVYMAPEQLRGFECDARTDVYALGATLYEALSGKRAYDAPTYADLVVRIVTGDARDLRQLVPALPARLSAIVMQALHHKPEKRYPTVQALADALQVYTEPRAAALTVSASAPRRRNSLWAGLAAGACALGLGLAVARWATQQAREPGEPSQAPPTSQPTTTASEPAAPPPATLPVGVRAPGDTAAAETVVQPAAAAEVRAEAPAHAAPAQVQASVVNSEVRREAPPRAPKDPAHAQARVPEHHAEPRPHARPPTTEGTKAPAPIVAPAAAVSGKKPSKRSSPAAQRAVQTPLPVERPKPSSGAATEEATPAPAPRQPQRTPKPRPALISL